MTYLRIDSYKVFLRPLSGEDSANLFSYRSKPEVAKFQLWQPVEINDAIRFIKKARFHTELINHQWNQFAICLRTNEEMIGDIGILLKDHKAEIGFTIAPHFQRKGFAFEAVTSLIKYLFQNHIVHTIIAYTDPKNVPSLTLLKKMDFYQDSLNDRANRDVTDLCFILKKGEKS
jgi:RimJ/RimL family protein N-acetyltransferase